MRLAAGIDSAPCEGGLQGLNPLYSIAATTRIGLVSYISLIYPIYFIVHIIEILPLYVVMGDKGHDNEDNHVLVKDVHTLYNPG